MMSLVFATGSTSTQSSAGSAPSSAESAHRSAAPAQKWPVQLTQVVAVQGGGIPVTDELSSAWLLEPTSIIDRRSGRGIARRFAEIQVTDDRCTQYVENKLAMIKHLKDLRNLKMAKLMLRLTKEGDPDVDFPMKEGWPSQELIDRFPSIVTIDLLTTIDVLSGNKVSVNVLPSWRDTGVLQIELTADNMDILLEDPHVEPTS